MSQVTIHTVDDNCVHIESMPDADALTLVTNWQNTLWPWPASPGVMILALDGDRVSHIATAHITRIDIDPEVKPSWWRRLREWWAE